MVYFSSNTKVIGNFKMMLYSKTYFLTISILLFCYITYGQQNDELIAKQNLTISKIDSLCNFIDGNKNLAEGIAEGGFVNRKGGWETYYMKSKDGDSVFRIQHNSSIDLYYKTTFYYSRNKVIKGIMTIEDWNSRFEVKMIYSAIYYFEKDIAIKVINENAKYSNATKMLKAGQNFQDEYYQSHSHF